MSRQFTWFVIAAVLGLSFCLFLSAIQAAEPLIAFKTHACYGMCPVYSTQIAADGTATTFGLQFTPSRGPFRVVLSPETLAELKSAFVAAGFCGLKDSYTTKPGVSFVTDLGGASLSFRCGDHLKSVYDYYGTPAVVRDLERKVQQAVQLERFLFADRQALEARFAGGLQPASREAEDLLLQAIEWGDLDLTTYLLDKGVSARTPVSSYTGRSTFLESAVRLNQADLLHALVDHGADVYEADRGGATLLVSALSGSGNRAIVSALIGFGVDVNQADYKGKTPLMYAALRERPDLVQLLLDAGANKDFRNSSGDKALACAQHGRNAFAIMEASLSNTVADEDEPDHILGDQARTISLLSPGSE